MDSDCLGRDTSDPWSTIAAGDTQITIACIPDLRSGVPIGVAYGK